MEVASAIQHGRRTSAHKAAGTSSNACHQPIRPEHSLAPMLLRSSNDTNTDLGDGSFIEVQTGPESLELRQEGGYLLFQLSITRKQTQPSQIVVLFQLTMTKEHSRILSSIHHPQTR